MYKDKKLSSKEYLKKLSSARLSGISRLSGSSNDPLIKEKPFYIRTDSAKISDSSFFENYNYHQKQLQLKREQEEEKKKKFPWKTYIIYAFIISLFVLIFGFLYIGGLWNPGKKLPGLHYVVVNNDRGCYTSACARLGLNEKMNVGKYYQRLDGTGGRFTVIEGDRNTAIEKVKKFKYWAAFYIPEKFTVDVLSNLKANKQSYTKVSVEVILDESRNYNTVSLVRKALRKLESNFSVYLARSFEHMGGFNARFLIEGITYEENNLHTVKTYGQNVAAFVTLMLIWISSISCSIITHFYFPFESLWLEKHEVHHPYIKIISLKLLTCSILTFVMTLILVLIQVICGKMTMEKGYAAYIFFVFFYSLIGLVFNNATIHLLPFIPYYLFSVIFMMLQVTTCGGMLDHAVQYGFWKIGRAFPMYYGTRQLRNIFWGVGEHTTLVNMLVLFAWFIVFLAFSLVLYYMELRVRREKWLRKEYRKMINKPWLNHDNNATALNSGEVPMESMEDFDFTDDDTNNNSSSNRTFE